MKVILDSGAFSAKWQGGEINLSEYIEYIKANEHLLEYYINLDVLGNVEATWKNQELLEKEGLSPVPVYHIDEDFKYLHRCLDNYEFFCIGGMAKEPFLKRRMIFDRCWSIICNSEDRKPKNKIHGLGMTDIRLLSRYPWYSVDSSSWVMYARYGMILIPRKIQGKYSYSKSPYSIFTSDKSPAQSIEGKHYNTLSNVERRFVDSYLDSINISLEDVQTNHNVRDMVNLIYYLKVEEALPEWPWAFTKGGLSL